MSKKRQLRNTKSFRKHVNRKKDTLKLKRRLKWLKTALDVDQKIAAVLSDEAHEITAEELFELGHHTSIEVAEKNLAALHAEGHLVGAKRKKLATFLAERCARRRVEVARCRKILGI